MKKRRKQTKVICIGLAIVILLATVAMVIPAHAMEKTDSSQTHTETSFRDFTEIIRKYFRKWFPEVDNDAEESTEESTEEVIHLGSPVISVTSTLAKKQQTRTINVKWEAVNGAESYIVQLSLYEDFSDIYKEKETTNDYFNYVISSGGTAPYYFPANATYYIRAKAVSSDMESEWSNAVVSGV